MAVQARQRDDSGKPIQLVYVRTARFVYPDFQVYCFVHHVHVCRRDKECSCKTETNYTRQHVMAIVLMTCMVVVIKVHWLIIIHVQNYCVSDCFPFVGLVAFLFLRGWFSSSKSAAVISFLLLPQTHPCLLYTSPSPRD